MGDEVRIGAQFRQHHVFDVAKKTVVLGMEDVVDGGEADVLVAAAVARNEMEIEKLVVVIAAGVRAIEISEADFDIAIGHLAGRDRIVCYVVEERMTCPNGAGSAEGGGSIALDEEIVQRARFAIWPSMTTWAKPFSPRINFP